MMEDASGGDVERHDLIKAAVNEYCIADDGTGVPMNERRTMDYPPVRLALLKVASARMIDDAVTLDPPLPADGESQQEGRNDGAGERG